MLKFRKPTEKEIIQYKNSISFIDTLIPILRFICLCFLELIIFQLGFFNIEKNLIYYILLGTIGFLDLYILANMILLVQKYIICNSGKYYIMHIEINENNIITTIPKFKLQHKYISTYYFKDIDEMIDIPQNVAQIIRSKEANLLCYYILHIPFYIILPITKK